jgi:Aminotransferase class-V
MDRNTAMAGTLRSAARSTCRPQTVPLSGRSTVDKIRPECRDEGAASERRYLDDPVQREEGGTLAIVEAIRAGLVFQLKQSVGVDVIRSHEEQYLQRAINGLASGAGHRDAGQPETQRLSIVSFVIGAPSGDICTTTSSSPCSTTCSGSSPVAASPARAPSDIGWIGRPGPLARDRPRNRSRL